MYLVGVAVMFDLFLFSILDILIVKLRKGQVRGEGSSKGRVSKRVWREGSGDRREEGLGKGTKDWVRDK